MTKSELLMLILSILGAFALAFEGLKALVYISPKLRWVQAKLFGWVVDKWKLRAFERSAIGVRIEEVVNQIVFSLQPYLPRGWIRRARVKWVRKDSAQLLDEGTIVILIRPSANNDSNLMNAVWSYFVRSLFPENADLLPAGFVRGAAMAVTRAGLEENHAYLLRDFDQRFIGSLIGQDQNSLDYFADCRRLNDYGMLMGPFFREINAIVTDTRMSPMQLEVKEVISAIARHMLSFQPILLHQKQEKDWIYADRVGSYGFILVSREPDKRPSLDAYINRAKRQIQFGASRIYVIGRWSERTFVRKVVAGLLDVRELKGGESFPLVNDYRGARRGLAFALCKDEVLSGLGLGLRGPEHRGFFDDDNDEALDQDDGVDLIPSRESVVDSREDQISDHGRRVLEIIRETTARAPAEADGWINLAQLGFELRRGIPNFEDGEFGGKKLMTVLEGLKVLEFKKTSTGPAFVRLPMPERRDSQGSAATSLEVAAQRQIVRLLLAYDRGDGWMYLARLGHLIRQRLPELDVKRFRAATLGEFIAQIREIEIDRRGEAGSVVYVRVRRSLIR